jgi:hypothetical protein
MATWEPYLDINNDSYRPIHFINAATALVKGAIVTMPITGLPTIPVSPFTTSTILGITGEAIAASASGVIYTSGIFYSSTGGGATIVKGDPVTGASASTLAVADTDQDVWGIAMGSTVSAAGVFTTDISSAGPAYFMLISHMNVGLNNPFEPQTV